ncbi:MAG: NADPH:quinone oxidoreductase family protein [Pseudomonadales bacterium]|nr:NADPH:quinone oxidoreductase family protein [Pseudomonadales bacterium]
MKVVYCVKYGSHQDLQVREIEPPPAPKAGQVKVELKARGIQFSDLVRMAGDYQDKSELPFVVGGEAAGIVTEVGSDVTHISVGDRVLTPGGCVEQINISAKAVLAIPENAELNVAASFRNNYATAYYGMQRANLQPGETLLVHGAAGGVGLAAVDIGKLYGATVIGTASSDEKLAAVKQMGADHVINYTDGFREQVKTITGGRGADVIYDPVGGSVFDQSMRCIAPFGRILVVGFTSGAPSLAKTNHLLVKDASVIGYTLGGLQRHNPQQNTHNTRIIMGWLESGRIKPFISHIMTMDEAIDGYQLLVDRKVVGKVILT